MYQFGRLFKLYDSVAAATTLLLSKGATTYILLPKEELGRAKNALPSPTLPEPYSRMFPISEDGSSSVSAGFETRLTVSKFVSAPSSVSRICKHDGSIKAGYTPLASPRIHSPSIPSSILTCSF